MWCASRNMPKRTNTRIQNIGRSFKYVLPSVKYTIQFSLFCVSFISSSCIISLVAKLSRLIASWHFFAGAEAQQRPEGGPTAVNSVLNTTSCIEQPYTCPHPRIQFYLYTRWALLLLWREDLNTPNACVCQESVPRLLQECPTLIAVLVRSNWKNKTGRTPDKHGRDWIFPQNFCRKFWVGKTSWNTWFGPKFQDNIKIDLKETAK